MTKDFTIREACRYLSEQLDGEIPAESIRRMYYRNRDGAPKEESKKEEKPKEKPKAEKKPE